MRIYRLLSLIFILSVSADLFSQTEPLYISYGKNSIPLLRDLLSIPNDAHYPLDIEKNVKWCENEFSKRGFSISRIDTKTVPLLLAEKRCNIENAKTVLIYLQIDGQPVDSNFWYQKDPYKAVLKEKSKDGDWEKVSWNRLEIDEPDPELRIFARSTADSKGAVVMFLTALDIMENLGENADFHMKVIMDFEEELGSPHLPQAVKDNIRILKSDMLIIFDGPRHLINEPTLSFGARGIIDVTIKVFGPYFPQHSGHYGNYVPNPALRMSKLLSSMKDDYGRVTIPGFYKGINISEQVKKVLRAVPDDERNIKNKLGIASADRVGKNYQESLQYPSLNIRGMLSGWVGEKTRTIVPSSATVELDIRLVLESDPKRLIRLVKEHIIDQGYHIVVDKPTIIERVKYERICKFYANTSYGAYRTDFNSDVGKWLEKALVKAFGKNPIMQRTSGGSIPISPFVIELGIPAVGVPTVNRDNNQHSPNENIRLGNYFDGIKTIHAILTEPLSN
ncbi:MAG: M20/M25/M40 family metallo-hydrolase [Saprospiraceae bacterium]